MTEPIGKKSLLHKGIYNLGQSFCTSFDDTIVSEPQTLQIEEGAFETASRALALNRYQPKNFTAIQETFFNLGQNQPAEALDHGIALRKKLDEIEEKIAGLRQKINVHYIDIAKTSQDAPYFNPAIETARSQIGKLQAELNRLMAEQKQFKRDIKEAAKLAVIDVKKQFEFFPPMIIEGKTASIMANLGYHRTAQKHFDIAVNHAKQNGFVLESLDFRLQSAIAEAHHNWESAATRLERLLKETDLEIGMRQESPEGMVRIWLNSQGDLDSMRVLRAQILGAEIEVLARNNSSNEKIGKLAQAVQNLIQNGNPTNTSSAEALSLLQALDIFQRHQIMQAQRLGQDARLEELEQFSVKMIASYNNASRLAADYPDDPLLTEQLGKLEASTFFYFWKEAGLPVTAIYSYMEQAKKTGPTEAKEAVIGLMLKRAPHFFDKEGKLLAKEQLPFPSQAEDAAFIEKTLHDDDASFVESLTIGTGTVVTGAAAGTKLGTVASPFCGFGAPLWIASGRIF